MAKVDLEKLEKLLHEGNWAEARKLQKDFFIADMNERGKSEAFLNIAELYVKVSNYINQQYEKDLDQALGKV